MYINVFQFSVLIYHYKYILCIADLIEKSYVFGRDKSCTFELTDDMMGPAGSRYFLSLSKKHFSITWDDDLKEAIIEDFSSNGTSVNHSKIREAEISKVKKAVLLNGSIITLCGKIKGKL